jgi:hypothetical protein
MGKSLLMSCDPSGRDIAATDALRFAGVLECIAGLGVPFAELHFGVAGTVSNYGININDVGVTRSFPVEDDSVATGITVAPADAASGIFNDTVNTYAVSDGSLLAVDSSEAGTNPTVYWTRLLFEADSGHASIHGALGDSWAWTTDSTTVYHNLLAGELDTEFATPAERQHLVRVAGTYSKLSAYVSSNARTTDTIMGVNKNGSSGNGAVTITALTTGRFTDSTNSDTVVSGDLLCAYVTTGTGAAESISLGSVATAFVSAGVQNDVFMGALDGSRTRAASATEHFDGLSGAVWEGSEIVEGQPAVTHLFAGTASRLRIHISANTYTGDAEHKLRINGADGNQHATITAGNTGWFEDASNTDAFTETDLVCTSIVGGTANSITYRASALTEQEGTPAVIAYVIMGQTTL